MKRTTKVKILPNSGNEFELSISAAETVESLKRRIELAEGIRAIEHRVVHNGMPQLQPAVPLEVGTSFSIALRGHRSE